MMRRPIADPSSLPIFPAIAISVRQPWAWAIIHAGKDIENRTPRAIRYMTPIRGRRGIHASRGMTREEYDDGRAFMKTLGIECPPARDLQRGGLIGSVDVLGVVAKHDSPWFQGPRGLVLANPLACDFIPAIGQLGFFRWTLADASTVPAPARWMLPPGAAPAIAGQAVDQAQGDLFG